MLAAAVAVVGVAARHIPVTSHAGLIVAVVSPFLALSGPVAVAVLLATRRRRLAAVAACVTVASLVPLLSTYCGSGGGRVDTTTLDIMTANLQYGKADADTLVREIGSDTDILAVQELTPDAVQRLRNAGLERALPFKTIYPQQDAGGAGLWSRHPIVSATLLRGFQMPLIDARVRIPDGTDLRLLVVHLSGPWPQPITGWRNDIARLGATLRQLVDEEVTDPIVVAGDFNATADLRPFRDLLRNGYRSAAQQAGEGRLPTFPNGKLIPPALDIDHIVTRNCAVSEVGTTALPGSDHRGLIATVHCE